MTPTAVPVTVTPEAEAYVAELGMQGPYRQMLDRILQTVPGLHSVEVILQEPYDLGGGPSVIFHATRDNPHLEYDPTESQFERWQIDTFPPEVFTHFVLLTVYGPPHER
jgi:hypothetical protein